MTNYWIMLTVEIIGIIILLVWIIVPIREFQLIAQRLRAKRRSDTPSHTKGDHS